MDNKVRKEPAEGGEDGSFPVELLPEPITLFLRSTAHKIRKQVLGFFFFSPYRTTQAAVLPGMLSQNYWSAVRYYSWRLQLSSWEKGKVVTGKKYPVSLIQSAFLALVQEEGVVTK